MTLTVAAGVLVVGCPSTRDDPPLPFGGPMGEFSPTVTFQGPYRDVSVAELRTEIGAILEAHVLHFLRIARTVAEDPFLESELELAADDPCRDEPCADIAAGAVLDLLDAVLAPDALAPLPGTAARWVHREELLPGTDPVELAVVLRSVAAGEVEVEVKLGADRGTVLRGSVTRSRARVRGDLRPLLGVINMSSVLDDLGDVEEVRSLAGTFEAILSLEGEQGANVSVQVGRELALELAYGEGPAALQIRGPLRGQASIDGVRRVAEGQVQVPSFGATMTPSTLYRALEEPCDCPSTGAPVEVVTGSVDVRGAIETARSLFSGSIDASGPLVLARQGLLRRLEANLGQVRGDATVQRTAVSGRLDRDVTASVFVDLSGLVDPERVSTVYRSGVVYQGSIAGAGPLEVVVPRDGRGSGLRSIGRLLGGTLLLRATDGAEVSVGNGSCLAVDTEPRPELPDDHPWARLVATPCP